MTKNLTQQNQYETERLRYVSDAQSFENNGAGKDPEWMKEVRKDGIGRFSELSFPTLHDEDWRFTNIVPLIKTPFRYAPKESTLNVSAKDVQPFILGQSMKSVIVFVNGHFSKELSNLSALGNDVHVSSLADRIAGDPNSVKSYLNRHLRYRNYPFAALNTGFIHDGAVVRIAREAKAQVPVQLLFFSAQSAQGEQFVSYPRNLIIVEEGATATFVESYASRQGDTYFTNTVTEVFVEKEAAVDYVKVQLESEKSFHVGFLQVQQETKSRFTSFSLALGSSIARNDMQIVINGEQCESMLDGLFITTGQQLIDHHTLIDHTQPNCSSREVVKGIVDGSSRAVFNGKIFVRQIAQKTDSKQTNKNLLLSDKATIDTKPQLEIFADDVKCTHGAAVGGLDDASLFYVKSRGISEEAARGILTVGFAGEATNYIANAGIREYVDALIIKKLEEKVVLSSLPQIVHQESAS
jgi:Fe-S cluster assembly protein SufD